MTAQGHLIELDAADGKELRKIRTVRGGGWCSARRCQRPLPGRQHGDQRRPDPRDRRRRQDPLAGAFPGVFRHCGCPAATSLAVSMTTKKVAELDRDGRTAWEVTCQGRPWSVQYR